MACGKRCVGEPGKPRKAPEAETAMIGYTAIEAKTGKPGTGARLESKSLQAHRQPGGRELVERLVIATSPRGVLSGIVL